MKQFFIYFNLIILSISCEIDTSNDENSDIDLTNSVQLENTSFTDEERKITNEFIKITDLYRDSLNKYGKIEFDFLNHLNDSISTLILYVSDGICSISFLATQLNDEKCDFMKLSETCDTDFSQPNYEWSEYRFICDTQIQLIEYFEYIPDSLLLANGEIPNNESREFFKGVTKDSTSYQIKILSSGKLEVKKE